MIIEQKCIRLKNRVVFERISMAPKFKRLPKSFYDDEACFLFVSKGRFKFRTPLDEIHFSEGDGMLAQCGNYLMETLPAERSDSREIVSVIGAFFYPDMVKEFFTTDLRMAPFREPITVSKVSVAPMLASFVEGLNHLLENPALADENLVSTKLKELLILLSKSEQAGTVNNLLDSLFTPYTYDFKKVVQQHLLTDITVAELAYLTGMAPATFTRRFRDTYRQSPAKYLLLKKLDYSLKLLEMPAKSISEIAFESGFSTASSFNKVFKKYLGTTPSGYRNGEKANSLSQMEN